VELGKKLSATLKISVEIGEKIFRIFVSNKNIEKITKLHT